MKVTSEVNVMKKMWEISCNIWKKWKSHFQRFHTNLTFLVNFLSYHSTGVKVQCMNMHLGVCSVKRDKKTCNMERFFIHDYDNLFLCQSLTKIWHLQRTDISSAVMLHLHALNSFSHRVVAQANMQHNFR